MQRILQMAGDLIKWIGASMAKPEVFACFEGNDRIKGETLVVPRFISDVVGIKDAGADQAPSPPYGGRAGMWKAKSAFRGGAGAGAPGPGEHNIPHGAAQGDRCGRPLEIGPTRLLATVILQECSPRRVRRTPAVDGVGRGCRATVAGR